MLIGIDASRAVIEQRTGTEVYSLHLIRHLVSLKPDWRFCLYVNTPPRAGLFPVAPHCQQRVIPFPRMWTHLRLSAEMIAHPPDVLFVPSHVLPVIHPRKSVVTVHDVGYRYFPEAHPARQRFYLDWSTRYHARAAAHLLADSQATGDDLVRIYGADPARITVVHLGIASDLCPVQDLNKIHDVKQKYGVSGDYILYVGTLQPRKNLVRLIEAFARVYGSQVAERPGANLRLVLTGKKGWLYQNILAQAQRLGLESQVIFTGFVDEADLAALYSGAALFAMPSLYEGFCFPVLEAMACGTPAVCSNTSSLPEVVGDAALTFDPLDVEAMAAAMVQVLTDASLHTTLMARGLKRARQFTWERCARQTLRVLEQVAEG